MSIWPCPSFNMANTFSLKTCRSQFCISLYQTTWHILYGIFLTASFSNQNANIDWDYSYPEQCWCNECQSLGTKTFNLLKRNQNIIIPFHLLIIFITFILYSQKTHSEALKSIDLEACLGARKDAHETDDADDETDAHNNIRTFKRRDRQRESNFDVKIYKPYMYVNAWGW